MPLDDLKKHIEIQRKAMKTLCGGLREVTTQGLLWKDFRNACWAQPLKVTNSEPDVIEGVEPPSATASQPSPSYLDPGNP
jgi:hypothetical protein